MTERFKLFKGLLKKLKASSIRYFILLFISVKLTFEVFGQQCNTLTSYPNILNCNGATNGNLMITADINCCALNTFYYQLTLNGNVIRTRGPFASNTYNFDTIPAGNYTVYVYQDINDLNDPLNACTSGGGNILQPSAINATVNTTNLICNIAHQNPPGGRIIVTVTGGTIGPSGHSCRGYQLSWTGPGGTSGGDPLCNCSAGNPNNCIVEIPTTSNSNTTTNKDTLSNLPAGPYNITVRDYNGCILNLPTTTITTHPEITASFNPTNIPCVGGQYGSISVSGLSAGLCGQYRFGL